MRPIFYSILLLRFFFSGQQAFSQDTLSTPEQSSHRKDTLFVSDKKAPYTAKDFGSGKINALQAKNFIGKEACVCGKVVSTKFRENGSTNPTYINLDKRFPDQVFTLMIYGADRKNFSYKPEEFLQGKTICVKGKIAEYKGIPQIIAGKEKQVEILAE